MALMRHIDFEVPMWGEFDDGPQAWIPAFYADDFNRANQPLETSPNWIRQGDAAVILSNQCQYVVYSGTQLYRWNGAVQADQFAQGTRKGGYGGVVVRIPPAGLGGYYVKHDSYWNVLRVYRYNIGGGSITQLGTYAWTNWAPGLVSRLEAVGNTLSVFINGTKIFEVSDPNNTWPTGGVGLGARGESFVMDNWSGGEL